MDPNQSTEISLLKPFEKALVSASNAAYNFQVALPGVSSKPGDMVVSIRKEGMVRIEIVVRGADCPPNADVLNEEKMQGGFLLPESFNTSFQLPGPVDPRLTSCSYKHGILDCTVIKFRVPPYFPNANH
ncbi:hypothetical protein AgCh_021444 [Apium graveolens]